MRELPKEVKEMQGTYEPSREGLEPVEFDGYERIPTAPREFPPNIQKLWMDRCADLKKAGYLVKAFMPQLLEYCTAAMIADEARRNLISDGYVVEEVGTKGQVYRVPSKWLDIWYKAVGKMESIGAKFGFTPLDAQKIPKAREDDKGAISLLK